MFMVNHLMSRGTLYKFTLIQIHYHPPVVNSFFSITTLDNDIVSLPHSALQNITSGFDVVPFGGNRLGNTHSLISNNLDKTILQESFSKFPDLLESFRTSVDRKTQDLYEHRKF